MNRRGFKAFTRQAPMFKRIVAQFEHKDADLLGGAPAKAWAP